MKIKSLLNPLIGYMSRGKPGLARIFFLYPMIIVTVTSLSLALYTSIAQYNRYKAGNELLKVEFPQKQRKELQSKILAVKDYIHFVMAHPAGSIAIYLRKQREEVGKLFLNASGSGNNNILPDSVREILDRKFSNSLIRFSILNPKGKLIYNSISNPDDSATLSTPTGKLSGKILRPEDNWIATRNFNAGNLLSFPGKISGGYTVLASLYPKDSIRIIQKIILDSLARVRYDNGEYIFINTFDGKGLITKGKLYRMPVDILQGTDTNWKSIFRKELDVSENPSGGFVTYNWSKDSSSSYTKKVSYISGLEEWQWIIGTGFHEKDIEPILLKRKENLRSEFLREFFKFSIFLIVLIASIYIFTHFLSKMTAANIRLFVHFFGNSSFSMQPIDENLVHFSEFQTLAIAANKMIVERDKIKSVLASEQSRLKYIIDAIPDLVFFKDTQGGFIGCNKAYEKSIGKRASEIIGKNDFDLFPISTANSNISSDRQILTNLKPIRANEWIYYPRGEKILCDTLKTLYFDQKGNVLGIIGISRDITEMEETRQRLILAKDKAEESDRLKTAFLANMSHEIRTPMNAIIGFSDLLSDDDLSQEEKLDFITKIKQAGDSLMNLINDIIDIAKIEAGQLTISESECNIDLILTNLHGTFNEIKNRTNKAQLKLKVSIPSKSGPLLTLNDPLRLQQVLTNLLSNALKFTDKGEVEFGYVINGKDIIFFVRDTGIGIQRSKQTLLFQRFSQIDSSTTRRYGGTGLGLAISKNIVELMGGKMWLESEPEIGSTFRFTIPLRQMIQDQENAVNSDNLFNWRGKTILVAEDAKHNFILIAAMLRFTDVSMLHALNGQEAIDMVKENPGINLVLMDIQMPVKDGYQAIAEIREIRPDLPLISFTAYALPHERERSLEAGCVDYISKPINPDLLLATISKYI